MNWPAPYPTFMTTNEAQIIALIEQNKYLSDDLKKRYILALFLMDGPHQADYLELWKAFDNRCQSIAAGNFKLDSADVKAVLRTVDEVKRELIQKIKSSHP